MAPGCLSCCILQVTIPFFSHTRGVIWDIFVILGVIHDYDSVLNVLLFYSIQHLAHPSQKLYMIKHSIIVLCLIPSAFKYVKGVVQ